MHLLVTRPEPDARRLAKRLAERGHDVTLAPLFSIHFLQCPRFSLEGIQALVATSRNGLRALAATPLLAAARRLPLFSVGAATTQLGESLGFQTIHTGTQSARSLPQLIARRAEPRAGPLLHLAGRHLAHDPTAELARFGFQLQRVVLYESVAADKFAPDVVATLHNGDVDGVLLMSRRSAQQFARLTRIHNLQPAISKLTYFCLSKPIADALHEALGEATCDSRISDTARLDALLALIDATAAERVHAVP